MPSFEVLLPIGAIGFYLYDATVWLYANELVLVRGRSAWRASIGIRMQAGGRHAYVPNPLAPGALLFRTTWDGGATRAPVVPLDVPGLRRALRPVQWITTLQALLLLVVLPPVSLVLGAGSLLLALFVSFYLLTLSAIAWTAFRRDVLHVSWRQLAWLSAEGLLCAPFAVNLVRKLTLARSHDVDWLQIVETGMAAAARAELSRDLQGRLVEMLAVEEPGSPESDRLEDLGMELKERLGVTVVA